MWKEGAAVIAAAGCACVARSEYEKRHFSVEITQVRSKKLKKDRCIAFLSDLHSNEFGPGNGKLIDAIHELRPDAVLIGGDMMVVSREGADFQVPMTLIKELSSRYPVYCGNGNHENRMALKPHIYGDLYERYKGALMDLGVILLEDDTAALGDDILVTGVDLDPGFYRKCLMKEVPEMPMDYLDKKLQNAFGAKEENKFRVLLAHSPLYFHRYADWGADLTLAGHFHGGTIRIPFLGGVMTPQYQFFLPWCAGYFEWDKKYMVVSRGLGTHSINIRFNNKPQLVAVQLKKK